ncbi:MAG TPA: aldehyde dehydrogenase family protein [Oligoflexus sp.]|uniref:aldehyde dehydrogenase family protein n=1 Tax=Oligoflexus sp. TaxID=1971216 RepID=UPI002D53A319|nr:aldehyde dehydrogenase family protein [Oligoflexus sp.]HYX32731.1 aldehyde dehydrogenase family protein [Oligoflexus sp.]
MFDVPTKALESTVVSVIPTLPQSIVDTQEVLNIMRRQDQFFASGMTLSEEFRRAQLFKLRKAVEKHEGNLIQAFAKDLRKSATEAYFAEIGVTLAEIRHALQHLRGWMKPERSATPMALAPARSEIRREPLGRCLILSPWNYPLLLNITPLVAALAAGNVVVLKPSELAPAMSAAIREMLQDTFPPELVTVLEGGVEMSRMLLAERWDLICFTGGTEVGRSVAQAAAKHLTPCILELGGKSPCLVSRTADLSVAARRIVWGKFLNAGQTCLAPDYILADESIHDALVATLREEILLRFGSEPLNHAQLPRIINQRHFLRLQKMLTPGSVIHGGRSDAEALLIEPTLVAAEDRSAAAMREEIFGPILPILKVKNMADAKTFVKAGEKPLALYLFTADRSEQEDILGSISFGGGCINDVLVHAGNRGLPFGGVGESGMGAYHGRHGFEAFSHRKAIVRNNTLIDVPLRYGPWGRFKDKAFRLFLN